MTERQQGTCVLAALKAMLQLTAARFHRGRTAPCGLAQNLDRLRPQIWVDLGKVGQALEGRGLHNGTPRLQIIPQLGCCTLTFS